MEVCSYSLTTELHAQIHSIIENKKSGNPLSGIVLVVDAPLQGLLLRRQLVESSTRMGLANIQVKTLDSVIRDLNSHLGLPEIVLPSESVLDAASYAAMMGNKTLTSNGAEALATAAAISSVFRKLQYNTDSELDLLVKSEISDTQKSVIESVLGVRRVLIQKLGISNFAESLENLISHISKAGFKSNQTHLILTSTLPKLAKLFFETLGSAIQFSVTHTDEKISEADVYVTAPDPQTETLYVTTKVTELAKSGIHPFDIAVVYSDAEQYGRLLASAFDDANISWHGAVETISQVSPLYRGFDLILQMLEKRNSTTSGAERPLVMRLLESGGFYVDGMRLDSDLCRHFVRDKELYGDSINWLKVLRKIVDPANKREQKAAEELKALLRALDRSLENLAAADSWSGFGKELFSVMEDFYLGANEENLSEDEKKIAIRFKQVLLQELPDIDELTPKDRPGLSSTASSVRSFLRQKIGDKKIRHGSLSVGVHLSDLSEVRLLNFQKIILIGATEGLLPSPNNQSMFLTDQMLDQIGELGYGALASNSESKVFGSNLLAVLSNKSPIILRSRSGMIGKLDDVPSRFLDLDSLAPNQIDLKSYNELLTTPALGPLAAQSSIKLVEYVSRPKTADLKRDSISEALIVFRNPTKSNYFGVVDNFSDELSISKKFLSASSIESFMDCEYKFFVTKILGIYTAEREDELKIWRAKDFGNLIHNSMESFLNDLSDKNELPDGKSIFTQEQVDLYFSKHLSAGLEEFYAKGHDAWRAGFESLMNRVERNLRHFFANEYKEIRSSSELGVFASELPFGHETEENQRVKIEIPGRPDAQFSGRIDRVDLSADGKTAGVLDFKSGKYRNDIPRDLGRPSRGMSVRTKVQDLVYSIAIRKKYKLVESVSVNFAYIATGTQSHFVKAEWMKDAEKQLGEIIERIYRDEDSGIFPVSHKSAIGENTYCDVCERLGWVAEQLRIEHQNNRGATLEDGQND